MPRFESRWLIKGTLMLCSELTLRSGDVDPIPGSDQDEPQQCARLHTDFAERPCLPGSSLKGAVRAWMATRLNDRAIGKAANPSQLEQVFGHEPRTKRGDPEVKQGLGGKAEFHDAFLTPLPNDQQYASQRLAHTAIDRATGTAKHRLLAHTDAVPAGSSFVVTITADNLTDDEATLLFAALEGFNASEFERGRSLPIRLGGGAGAGRGRAFWQLDRVLIMDAPLLGSWLATEPTPHWQAWLEHQCSGAAEDPASWRGAARAFLGDCAAETTVSLGLALAFATPFVVNDPTRCKGKGHPDLEPRVDAGGRALLPGTSVKGVLRAHAERIWRTVHGSLPAAEANKDGRPRNAMEWLFGVGGWRGALIVDDFREASDTPAEMTVQDFVAIDRFTGGAADTAKFQARIVEAPRLSGTIALRVRPADRRAETFVPSAVGILALLIRDLIQGDLTFGHGATKGMGTCRAEITSLCRGDIAKHPAFKPLLAHRGDGKPPDAPLPWPVTRTEAATIYGPILKAGLSAFRSQETRADAA